MRSQEGKARQTSETPRRTRPKSLSHEGDVQQPVAQAQPSETKEVPRARRTPPERTGPRRTSFASQGEQPEQTTDPVSRLIRNAYSVAEANLRAGQDWARQVSGPAPYPSAFAFANPAVGETIGHWLTTWMQWLTPAASSWMSTSPVAPNGPNPPGAFHPQHAAGYRPSNADEPEWTAGNEAAPKHGARTAAAAARNAAPPSAAPPNPRVAAPNGASTEESPRQGVRRALQVENLSPRGFGEYEGKAFDNGRWRDVLLKFID